MKDFCPRCGKEKGPFLKGFCMDCFAEKKNPINVLKENEIEKCKKCEKIKLSGIWVKPDKDNLSEFLKSKIKTKEIEKAEKKVVITKETEKEITAKIIVKGKIDSERVEFEKEFFLKKKNGCCVSCSKIFGNYFEAMIQLRSGKKDFSLIEKKVEKIEKLLLIIEKKDPLARIIKVVKDKNGVDLFIGSNRSAKKVVSALETTAKQKAVASTTLQGVDRNTGKNRYRYTYCLRF